MTTTLLFEGNLDRGRELRQLFVERAPDYDLKLLPEVTSFDGLRYLVSTSPSQGLLAKLTDLEVIFSTAAGVDQFDVSSLPDSIRVIRMMEPGIAAGVVEYAVLGALALHRDFPHYLRAQAEHRWMPLPSVAARERRIGILGIGSIGQAVAAKLASFDFPLLGWSRSPKQLENVQCYNGSEQLPEFAAQSDILICLLPLTTETRGILAAPLFGKLPMGAMLLNAGRGAHVVAEDLIAALNSGRLSAAMLDVADPEPLPPDHPFWLDPRIVQTPHIAGRTRPEGAFMELVENLRRYRDGQPMRGIVACDQGY